MSFNINKLLVKAEAMPNQENWELLDEEFRKEYDKLIDFMQNPSNYTESRTTELKEMDDKLCEMFTELHEISDDEPDETTTDENLETDDMKNKHKKNTESEEILNEIKQPVVENTTENIIETKELAPEKNNDTPGSVEQAPVSINNNDQFADFVAFASSHETISAKDLVNAKIPEALWKENKPEFKLGNLTFKKTVTSLIFNKWQVIKDIAQ